ncbi:hypothetical protein PQC06_gp101 [Aeromonas phage LAh10]|uniref:Uncharacterized protein n=1 Tax=Aeromonas phage LAh10 TaxID=2591025 RepID=A0A514A1M7_9CAUD|nr:hypothetical protein PQC06_gp101 [Aeromonas phage LAh10]QDH47169.1 hypothetical protein LAh10_101 [Aeromonas phage LAh10]
MKLHELYRKAVRGSNCTGGGPLMLFSGVMKNGPESKSKLPGKVFGLCCQQYGDDDTLEEEHDLAAIEIESPVGIILEEALVVDELGDILKLLSDIDGEDALRIGSDINSVLDVSHTMHRSSDARQNAQVGIWVTKLSKTKLPGEFVTCTGSEEEDFFYDVTDCIN